MPIIYRSDKGSELTSDEVDGNFEFLDEGKQDSLTFDSTPTDGSSNPVTSDGVFDALATKQDTLISGTNIKTVNGTSLLGSGNVAIGTTIADGDYGDVVVSGTGTVMTIDNLVVTNAKLAGSIAASKLVGTDIATVGTITSGTWNGSVIAGQYGGTGVANTGKTITVSGNLATSGAFDLTIAVPRTTTYTLPNTANETLAGLGTAQTFTLKQTFTAATTEITALTVLDTTYKTALSTTAGVLELGAGFSSTKIKSTGLLIDALFQFSNSSGTARGYIKDNYSGSDEGAGSFVFGTGSQKIYLQSGVANFTLAGAYLCPPSQGVINSGNSAAGTVFNWFNGAANNNTIGTRNLINVTNDAGGSINPTSGSAAWNYVNVAPLTINQTGSTGIISCYNAVPGTVTRVSGVLIGYRSQILASPSGGGAAWNIYADGTAGNYFGGDVTIQDKNLILGTTTGLKLGTATGQKLGIWNATPIVQPTTAIAASTFVANTSLISNDTATFDGYTIGQVVKALRNLGILA